MEGEKNKMRREGKGLMKRNDLNVLSFHGWKRRRRIKGDE